MTSTVTTMGAARPQSRVSVAVLDQDPHLGQVLHFPDRRGRVRVQVVDVEQLVYVADAAGVYQLWLHPRWLAVHPVANLDAAWNVAATDDERRRVAIVAPSLDRDLQGFAVTSSGEQLLQLVCAFQEAIGSWLTGSPGRTAEAMLRADLRRHGLHNLTPLPEIARTKRAETPFAWIRPLTPVEAARPFLIAVDKHAAYLVAWSHVELGIGDPEHRTCPDFDRKLPGYWRARTADWSSVEVNMARLPDPSRGTVLPREAADDWRWLSTPSVRAAAETGTLLEIDEAWVWPKHTRLLARHAALLRGARARFVDDSSPVAQLAVRVVKALYTQQVGRFRTDRKLSRADQGEDPLYRPDWYDAFVSEARVNAWHNVRPLSEPEINLAPVGVAIDCWYIASSVPTAPVGLRYGTAAGEYDVKVVRMADARDVWDRPRLRIGDLKARVDELPQVRTP